MTTTPVLGLTELASAQALPETTVNENTRWLEFFASGGKVLDRGLVAEPGSPVDGDAYLLTASPTGTNWSGQGGKIALRISTAWEFKTAKEGMRLYVADEDVTVVYDGSAWNSVAGTAYTDEQARDAIAAMIAAGTHTNFTATYNDAGDSISFAATGGGGGGGSWSLQWGPVHNEPPLANYATLDTRNSRPVLDFDTTTQEAAIFSGVLPADYAGGGVTVSVWCALTSATSGTVGWDVAIERCDASSLDIDADSFASAQTITATTVPGTSGQVLKLSVNISNGANMDSLAAGELFRLRIRRDVANDTATGDAELLRVMMVEQ